MSKRDVRCARAADSDALLVLYRDLVGDAALGNLADVARVLAHPGTAIWTVWQDEDIRAMATLHILPNVTQGGRPYALVENVVTRSGFGGAGFGRLVMEAVIDAAWTANAYKIMLLTGRTALARGFYERLGFSADEKWGMSLRRVPVRGT